jgi:hypothetical protein
MQLNIFFSLLQSSFAKGKVKSDISLLLKFSTRFAFKAASRIYGLPHFFLLSPAACKVEKLRRSHKQFSLAREQQKKVKGF